MSAQAAQKLDDNLSYDEVPYESFAYPHTFPAHLSTVSTLFGLNPADFKTARVLEIGCASGGNIAPLAALYPKAKFLGIDLSKEQIDLAQKRKEFLKLNNLEFAQQDILEFSPKNKNEKFDYILCHGILSWVPEKVQKKIFEICNEWLEPKGVAVISYNALPGWNAVRSLREMMLYHTNRFQNPSDKVQQSRSLLEFLAENVPEGNTSYSTAIKSERDMLQNLNNSYLYHDHLESTNNQFYLHEFARTAKEHGLDYVGDTNLSSMYLGNMPAKAVETLGLLNDVVSQEQYMDFITNRRFRTSILCKENQIMKRNLDKAQIMNYFITPNPAMKVDGNDPKKDLTFSVNAGTFTTHNEVAGTLFLEILSAGQKPIHAKDIVKNVAKKLDMADPKQIEAALIEIGIQLMLQGYLNLHSDSPEFVSKVSEKPTAFSIARFEAQKVELCKSFTNVLGNTIPCDITAAIIMKNLDGTKTKEDLLEILLENIKSGILKVAQEGKPVTDGELIKTEMVKAIDNVLKALAQNALLIK